MSSPLPPPRTHPFRMGIFLDNGRNAWALVGVSGRLAAELLRRGWTLVRTAEGDLPAFMLTHSIEEATRVAAALKIEVEKIEEKVAGAGDGSSFGPHI